MTEPLIDDLLNFARINVNKDECDHFNINSIVDMALSELNYIMTNKKINLQINKNFPNIFCHKNLMIRVYSNLLSNAIKYSKKNNIVNISIGYHDDEIFHKFYISDDGIGIPSSKRNKLFKLFSRLNESVNVKGNGLGLAITKRIIEGHGGEIWVESTYRKGTTFYFTIPR